MFSRLAFLLIVLSIAFYSRAAFIQPLTRTPLRPFSVNQNYTTDYSFAFYIPTAIYFGAFIEVEFPLPYQISSACQAYLKAENSPINQFSCEKTSSSTYLIDVGQLVSGNYELVLEGIKNPTAYSASSNLKLRTLFNKNIPVDSNEYFDSIPFLSSPVTTKSGLVVNQGYSGVNLGTRFDFTFTLTKGLSVGDSIKFNMPEGFYTVKPTCFHKNSGSYTTAEVLYNNRMIICQAFQYAMTANVTQTVSVIGIVNPGHTGTFNGFSIETMQGLSPNILESVSVQSTVLVKAGSVTVNIASTSLYLVVNTTHQLNLLFENDVPAGSQIWIKIPPGFRYLAPNCTLIKTLDAVSGGNFFEYYTLTKLSSQVKLLVDRLQITQAILLKDMTLLVQAKLFQLKLVSKIQLSLQAIISMSSHIPQNTKLKSMKALAKSSLEISVKFFFQNISLTPPFS